MSNLEIILLSVALAMDCFAVSICKGVCMTKFNWSDAAKMAGMFGLFQAGMAFIGFRVGHTFMTYIESFDHWFAFVLLLFIGGRMIINGFKPPKNQDDTENKPLSWKVLFTLAVATSVDALAAGVVFVSFAAKLWSSLAIIGIISLIFSLIGSLIGYYSGKKIKFNVEIIGGIILIAIGVKILVEHLIQG